MRRPDCFRKSVLPALCFCLLVPVAAEAQDDAALIAEHVYGGMPSNDNLLVRTAYVVDYDPAHKAPLWAAYHLTEDYRRTPRHGAV